MCNVNRNICHDLVRVLAGSSKISSKLTDFVQARKASCLPGRLEHGARTECADVFHHFARLLPASRQVQSPVESKCATRIMNRQGAQRVLLHGCSKLPERHLPGCLEEF